MTWWKTFRVWNPFTWHLENAEVERRQLADYKQKEYEKLRAHVQDLIEQETNLIALNDGVPSFKSPHPTREEPIELFADPKLGPTCFEDNEVKVEFLDGEVRYRRKSEATRFYIDVLKRMAEGITTL